MVEKNIDTCEEFCFNPEAVQYVREQLLAEKEVQSLAETFKVLGDRTRIRILQALSLKELCVCDLSSALEMTPSAISHQLRVLKAARLVKYRREGKNVYYSMDDEHITSLFGQALDHIRHN